MRRATSDVDSETLRKQCKICKEDFEVSLSQHQKRCCSSECHSEYRRRSRSRTYKRVKKSPRRYAKRLAQGRASARGVRQWLAEYKLELGCADCGYRKHSAALQFDHEGPKTASISELRSSKKRILEEIERGKCVCRCANCHAIKTWERKQPQRGR